MMVCENPKTPPHHLEYTSFTPTNQHYEYHDDYVEQTKMMRDVIKQRSVHYHPRPIHLKRSNITSTDIDITNPPLQYLISRLHQRPMVTLSPTSTIGQTMQLLCDNKILSAPVVSGLDQFLGIVDVHDILNTVVKAGRCLAGVGEDWQMVAEQSFNSTLGEMLPSILDQEDIRFVPLGMETDLSLSEVVSKYFLPEGARPVHRLAVMDSDGCLDTIISQSDIIRYLQQCPEGLHGLENYTLQSLGFTRNPIVKVNRSHEAGEVLTLMYESNLRIMPVVDSKGRLMASLSTSVLRGMKKSDFKLMNRSVGTFVKRLTGDKEPISLQGTNTLKELMTVLVENNAHHAFICDQDNKVLSVVTLTDILRTVYDPERIERLTNHPTEHDNSHDPITT